MVSSYVDCRQKSPHFVENYVVAILMAIFSGTFSPEVGALCGTMAGLFRSHGLLNLGHKEALFFT